MQFLVDTNYKFVTKKRRRIGFVFSIILIIIGIVFYLINGGFNLGIDFEGGATLHYKFKQEVKINQIRKELNEAGYSGAIIQRYGSPKDLLIKIEQGKDLSRLKNYINGKYSNINLESEEKVGPSVGKDLQKNSLYAIIIALIGILIYVSWRFQFKYSIGAILALLHDVLITLGAFAVFQFEFDRSVLAAILMVIGYSLNDTIVVFDRIREYMRTERPRSDEHYETTVNKAINNSLSRTIITSLTTLMVIIVLYLAGGQILRNFSFALLVGVVVGTYSSVFISSPVLIEAHLKVSDN
ncbi:MAG: protein translocase subunit SecF [Candidatus Mcinerneyibacterium aminivorans]|jgi:preprotein translocase subunit SecF|uniref:Protein-export membrane protein SecF n=1 Tax=Candidatus Mcinerneyibacterium aminivorans TaxID=2703815 RepID=A0A5D0MG72_9BACT|nr:MAG: protein translocase subunit SecF [Candidatus Mcinerneyibacterium aminivorans]